MARNRDARGLRVNDGSAPAEVGSLAAALDIGMRTIDDQHEPSLIPAGLVVRAAQERIAAQLAYEWV